MASSNGTVDVNKRRPFRCAQLAIDLANKPVHFSPQLLVSVNALTRGYRNLYQDDLLPKLGGGSK